MDVRFDKRQLADIKKILEPKKYDRAIKNAVNATATKVRKICYVEATKEYNIKATRLKKDPRGKPTSYIQRANRNKPTAKITFRGGSRPKSGDRPGLSHFAIGQKRNKKKGSPKIKMRRTGSVEVVERGFYGIGKLKGQGIFQRNKTGRKLTRRTGPSTKQMVEDPKVFSRVQIKSVDILHDAINDKVIDQLRKP